MIERALRSSVLVVVAGLASPAWAQEPGAPPKASVIFNLINRPTDGVESRDRAFNEAIKQDALAPRPPSYNYFRRPARTRSGSRSADREAARAP